MSEQNKPRPRRLPVAKNLRDNAAFMEVTWTLADAAAIQALTKGTADADQQRRALSWILLNACALPEWPYHSDSERNTNVALGRHFVGHQIVLLQKAPLGQMRRDEPNADPHEPK